MKKIVLMGFIVGGMYAAASAQTEAVAAATVGEDVSMKKKESPEAKNERMREKLAASGMDDQKANEVMMIEKEAADRMEKVEQSKMSEEDRAGAMNEIQQERTDSLKKLLGEEGYQSYMKGEKQKKSAAPEKQAKQVKAPAQKKTTKQ